MPLPQQNVLILSFLGCEFSEVLENDVTRHEERVNAFAAVLVAVLAIYGSIHVFVYFTACSSTLLRRGAHNPELSSDGTRSSAEWPQGGRTHR